MLAPAFLFALSLNAPLAAVPSTVPAETTPVMSVAEASAVCPVCGKAVAPGEGSKATVRGQEYAVSDKACGDELVANPDKYLNADGTPKNAKKETKPM
jgi:YHS domain-containing protein